MKHRVIKIVGIALSLVLAAFLISCKQQEAAGEDLYRAVDELYATVVAGADSYEIVAQIDHSRLAAQEGEVMPPARVVIFSDPGINTPILLQEPMAGLDLPFRVLAYADRDSPAVLTTPADFLKRRHDLTNGPALQNYEEAVSVVLNNVPGEHITVFDTSSIGKEEGIIGLSSQLDFDQTIQELKDAIMAEGDTVWFGEIDYRAEAASLGKDLPNLTLLLFGAPAPGGKAMAWYPRMGLDAFCQKLLVYQPPGEQVSVYFNDMAALAEIHYGDSALPHKVITRRMTATLASAIEE